MIEMELSKIVINETRSEQLILLKEKGGSRALPIVIGINEASSIRLELSGFVPPRPLTHDLLKSSIEKLGGRLKKIVIDKLENNTFHAKLVIGNHSKWDLFVDARPSDGIALAVRAKVPIFVEEKVLIKAESQEEL